MLYYIDESVLLAARNNNQDVVEILKDFVYAWRKGQCLVSASRSTLSELKKLCGLEQFSLVERYAQGIHSLYTSLDFFVVLVANNAKVTVLQQFANKYVVMDISVFNDPKLISLNYLVCENVRDCDFYVFGTKQLLSRVMGNSYQLNVEEGNGGGGTIIDVLKVYEPYSCLAICDSDKKYPQCGIGKTLSEVLAYFSGLHGCRMWMYALQVHEVENLIPIKLLEKIRYGKLHKNRMKTISSIASASFGGEFLKHFDFKKGFREKLLVDINEKDAQFVNVCKQTLLHIGKSQHVINNAISNGKDSAKELVSGFGDVIFSDTLDYIQNNHIHPSLLQFDSYQQSDWNAIANKVWSLGCAMVPRRL